MPRRMLGVFVLALLMEVLCPGRAFAQDTAQDVGDMVRTMRASRREGEAREALKSMRTAGPDVRASLRVIGQRVLALQDLRKMDEAQQLLTGLPVTADVDLLQIKLARLRILLDLVDPEDAANQIIQMAAKHKGNLEVVSLHVRALIQREDFRAAHRELDALTGDSSGWLRRELEAELLAGRARSLLADDSLLEEALPLLEEALKLAPHRGDMRVLYANALVRWQRFDQAEEQLQRGLESAGVDRDALLMGQADLYRSTDRLAEAIAGYEMVLAESPGARLAQVGLARCQSRMGEKEEAIDLLKTCLAADPDDLDALLVLAEIREGQGRIAEAEAALRHVLELRPNHLKACWRLSRVLAREGKMNEVEELVVRYESRRERVRQRFEDGSAIGR